MGIDHVITPKEACRSRDILHRNACLQLLKRRFQTLLFGSSEVVKTTSIEVGQRQLEQFFHKRSDNSFGFSLIIMRQQTLP